MVKLQKHFAYKYNDKRHFKHIITIPEEIIEELGWKEGIELEQSIENNQLIFKPIKKTGKGVRFES